MIAGESVMNSEKSKSATIVSDTFVYVMIMRSPPMKPNPRKSSVAEMMQALHAPVVSKDKKKKPEDVPKRDFTKSNKLNR
jgi:hypothetical protein